MCEISAGSPSSEEDGASELFRCSLSVVTALDRLFDYLITRSPAEGACGEIPLSFSEVRALRTLPMAGSMTMHELAEGLSVPVSTATRVVDRLVAKKLATRLRPDYDRRLVLVELSRQSRAHREQVFHRHVGLIEQMLEPLSPASRQEVARVFDQIAQVAGADARVAGPDQTNGLMVSSEAGNRS